MAKRLSAGQKMPAGSPEHFLDRLLRSPPLLSIQVFLYLSVLFLWFKNNFYPLRDMSFPLLIPLIPLGLILTAQIGFFLGRRIL